MLRNATRSPVNRKRLWATTEARDRAPVWLSVCPVYRMQMEHLDTGGSLGSRYCVRSRIDLKAVWMPAASCATSRSIPQARLQPDKICSCRVFTFRLPSAISLPGIYRIYFGQRHADSGNSQFLCYGHILPCGLQNIDYLLFCLILKLDDCNVYSVHPTSELWKFVEVRAIKDSDTCV